MKNKALVKLSNIIGVIAIILLVYWVFVFISVSVFGLKIFRENITETFYYSVIGILALMFGALIINVMFNLTRIAEKHNADESGPIKKDFKKTGMLFLLSFPLLLGLLFAGDYLTSRKKEKMLIASAQFIIENNVEKTTRLLNYSFNKNWIKETNETLDIFSKTDKHFPYVMVLVADSIAGTPLYLGFKDYYSSPEDSVAPQKKDFIQPTTKADRAYLQKVFFENQEGVLFRALKGRYELFYPYHKNGKKIVLYFSDYQRYGKFGS